jgi:hypothetical protein
MTNRQILVCKKCGAIISAGREAAAVLCDQCLMDPQVSGKPGPVLESTPLRGAVDRVCDNAWAGDACLRREEGCAVLRSQRCRFFEKLLPLAGERARAAYARLHPETRREDLPRVRTCPDCGTRLPPGRRVCNDCRAKRRKNAYRRSRGQNGASRATLSQKNTPSSGQNQGCFSGQSQGLAESVTKP